jgi:hypothetical protein
VQQLGGAQRRGGGHGGAHGQETFLLSRQDGRLLHETARTLDDVLATIYALRGGQLLQCPRAKLLQVQFLSMFSQKLLMQAWRAKRRAADATTERSASLPYPRQG